MSISPNMVVVSNDTQDVEMRHQFIIRNASIECFSTIFEYNCEVFSHKPVLNCSR